VISLAPSITETLFALGCADKVVGVTRYCKYPPEAQEKEDIGGYFDPNFEAITALRPDLVILRPEHQKAKDFLDAQGIPTLSVKQDTLEGLLASLDAVGDACGERPAARALKQKLEKRLQAVQALARGSTRPRVLITAGRDAGKGEIGLTYIAGKGNFYSQLVELAGGTNAYEGELPLPSVSREGLMGMNPDVIVEMIGDISNRDLTLQEIVGDWTCLPEIKAVQTGRVHPFVDDFDVIPGPRIVNTLEKLVRLLNDE